MKLSRARAHVEELINAMAGWVEPVQHQLDVEMSDDGMRIEARLHLAQPIPHVQWALIVGDCAHNVRTALDVFVWENSVLLPKDERGLVGFPILPLNEDIDDVEDVPHRLENQTRKVQRSVTAKVRGLPEPLRTRVIGNMRWSAFRHDGDLVWHQGLPLLRDLDDADKHRIPLSLEVAWNMAVWDVSGWDSAGDRVDTEVEWIHAPISSESGESVLVGVGASDRQIERVSGTASIALGVRVELDDRALSLPETLLEFIDEVDGLLDLLCDDTPLV